MNKNKNINKTKDKAKNIDSNTLHRYNDDMSKKAVGKLMKNANKDENVRSVSRDEYNAFYNSQKTPSTSSNKPLSNKSNEYGDNLNNFIKNNQTITEKPDKKFNTIHKNELKDKINKLTNNESVTVNKKTKSVVDTYVHEDLPKKVNENIKKERKKAPVYIDDFSPSKPKKTKKEIPPQGQKQKPVKNKKPENDRFSDDNYFSTLRTSRLSPSDVELDYGNLPYSTKSHKNLKNEVRKKTNEEKYIDEEVAKEADKHIEEYNKTATMNQDLVNIVRQTTQEMEKEKIKKQALETKYKKASRNKKTEQHGTHSDKNEKVTNPNNGQKKPPKQTPTANQKRKRKANPTVAFIRISSFIVIIILSISLINSMIKSSGLRATIKEQEEQIEISKNLTAQVNELTLENERLREELNNTNDNESVDTDTNTDEESNDNTRPDLDIVTLPTEYTVKTGDNLSKISRTFYGDESSYNKIVEANNLSDTGVYVGQVLTIPQ